MEASTIDVGRVREQDRVREQRVREQDHEKRMYLAFVCLVCVPYWAALAYAVYLPLSFVF